MKIRLSVIRESLIAEVISITGASLVGFGLVKTTGIIHSIPGMLAVIPGILALRGGVSGSLAARLGTALHTGIIEPKFEINPTIKSNVLSAIILGFIESILVALIAYMFTVFANIPSAGLHILLFISVIGGTLAATIGSFTTLIIAFQVYRIGIDPDSVMSPIATMTGDVVSISSLFLAVTVAKQLFGIG
jgi:mgtE-like transporter